MKIYFLIIVLIIVVAGCRLAMKKAKQANTISGTDLLEFGGALYPIKKAGKWGYMDNKLQMVIPARFASAGDFNEGMAAVSERIDDGNGQFEELYGYIDSTGKLVVAYKYQKAVAFAEGLAVVVKNGRYGYINKEGKEIVSPQYEDASGFSEGLAVVKKDNKNGFIDKTGHMVIEPTFDRACRVSVFSEGLSPVYMQDGSAGYIDNTGNFVIPPVFTYVSAFSEGLALVQPQGTNRYGYINRKGEIVIEPKYELSLPFCEGVATVKMLKPDGNVSFSIIDKTGKTIAGDLRYSFTGIFQEGLAGVESYDHRWGFIDKNGREIIPPRFASVRLFHNGLSMIQTGSLFTELNTGYIDKSGNIVVNSQ